MAFKERLNQIICQSQDCAIAARWTVASEVTGRKTTACDVHRHGGRGCQGLRQARRDGEGDSVSEPIIVLCLECNQASLEDEWRTPTACPNPGCFAGGPEYREALRTWGQAKEEYIKEQQRRAREARYSFGSYSVLEEGYERVHPRPATIDFERPHRGYTRGDWNQEAK